MKKIKPKYYYSQSGYKGLIMVECPDCGVRVTVNFKNRTSWFHCRNCMTDIPMEKIRKAYIQKCYCCGRSTALLTNIPDDSMEIRCRACGAPVDLVWNEKKGVFVNL